MAQAVTFSPAFAYSKPTISVFGGSLNHKVAASASASASSSSTIPKSGRQYKTLGLVVCKWERDSKKPLPLQVRCLASAASSSGSTGVLTPELKATLDKFVTSNKVVLFMKGTKDFPQCGFSNTVVQILKSLNVSFQAFDILGNELLRQGLKEYSNWPTFPQLYIDGEFFGGCDITLEAYKTGELQELLEKAMCS